LNQLNKKIFMKQLSILSIAFLLVAAVAFTGFQQQEKDKKNKKEQLDNRNKGKKNKPANENSNKNDQQPGKKNQKANQGKNNSPGNNNGKGNDKNRGNARMEDDYNWDRETFKDRNKYKNQEKVTICHKFNDDEPAVTLSVSVNALKAHIAHGDVEGDCPNIRDDRYSDRYLNERNDYYERIQESREKVFYSQSILDYAIQRLTDSRVQLATMRTNNVPQVEIERKQVVVLELEENVSLLETLIGVTANLLANKLQ